MAFFLAAGVILLAGILTVLTETFTQLNFKRTGKELVRFFLTQALLFSLVAFGWACSVWVLLYLDSSPVSAFQVFILLGLAHLPMLIYPLTVAPTIGYRLEQILRMSVFLLLVFLLWSHEKIPMHRAFLVGLPGWLMHFGSVEWRLLRDKETSV